MPVPEDRADWTRRAAAESGAAPARVAELLNSYGTTAREIAALEGAALSRLTPTSAYSVAEIDWIARNERVVHLEDVVLRRTQIAITGALDAPGLQCIAEVVAQALGWDPEQREEEMTRCRETLERRHWCEPAQNRAPM